MSFETTGAAILAVLLPVGKSLLTSTLRTFMGFWENATKPESEGGTAVTKFEWANFASTVFRVGILDIAATGLLSAFIDSTILTWVAGAGSAILLDFILSAITKPKVVIQATSMAAGRRK